MKLKTLTFVIAIIVIVIAGAYGINKKINPYSGLVTHIDVQSTPETIQTLQSELDTYLAGIAASKSAGETPELDLYILAGTNAYYLGNLAQAREIYEEYLEHNAINPVGWINYANILKKMEDYDNAEIAFKKAIELDDESESRYGDLIALYYQVWPEERNEEIKNVLEQDIEVNGQTRWNMVKLGDWYFENDDCDRAIAHYRVALSIAQNDDSGDDIINGIKGNISEAHNNCPSDSSNE